MTDVSTNTDQSSWTFDYSEADVGRFTSAPQLASGMYKALLTDVSKADAKESHNMQLTLSLKPLDGNDDPQEFTLKYFLSIPVANPRVPGHKFTGDADKAFDRAEKFIRTIAPDSCPRYFKWDPEAKVSRDENGEPVSKAEAAQRKKEVKAAVFAKLKALYTDPSSLVSEVVYMMVNAEDQAGNVKDFSSIAWITNNPGDKPVKTDASEFKR